MSQGTPGAKQGHLWSEANRTNKRRTHLSCRQITELPFPRRSAILYDGILYVMGGKLSDDQRPTVVEVLNTGDPGQDFQEHAYPLLTGTT